MEENFNFYDLDNQDIVIQPTKGVAAYISDFGYLVIRQEGEQQDSEILINPEHIEQFVLRINDITEM